MFFEKMWVKLLGAVIVAGVIMWAIHEIRSGWEAKDKLKVAYQDLSAEQISHSKDVQTFTDQQKNDQHIGAQREDAISDLRDQLIDYRNKHPDVRLHNCSIDTRAQDAIPHAASQPDAKGTGEQRQETEQPSGPNISEGLGEIAESADRCAINKNALIEWIKRECEIAKNDGRGCTDSQ